MSPRRGNCVDCDPKNDLLARLNKRVTIQRIEKVPDSYGQPVETWVDVATVWAAIEPLRGREYFAAMSEHAEVTTRIRIRYRSDVDRTMRVVHGSTEFEILHIIHPDFARQELQLMCKERQ